MQDAGPAIKPLQRDNYCINIIQQYYNQLNCKKHTEGEIPEKEEKLIESTHSGRTTLKQAKTYS